MKIKCVWEHNGEDSLLYASEYPGAFTRGNTKDVALSKIEKEIAAYMAWTGIPGMRSHTFNGVKIVQDAPCKLQVCDADSDVIFDEERLSLDRNAYERLKALVLRSASDFLALYHSVPDKNYPLSPLRSTFYGQAPRTAEEMYQHTKNVNAYYFGEIGMDTDNEGTIFECRKRGFEELEKQENFLIQEPVEGSYGEVWSLRKLLRRFLWHDRIHAKAMYKRAVAIWGKNTIANPFFFD